MNKKQQSYEQWQEWVNKLRRNFNSKPIMRKIKIITIFEK